MNDNDRLRQSIEEGVSKGVPFEFIAYSLVRAGWPKAVVDNAILAWRKDTGRDQKTTDFKQWLKKYYAQAKPAVALMVVLNTIADFISLLQPLPLAVLANSVFGTIPAPGPLKPFTHTPKLILIVAGLTLLIFLLSSAFGVIKDYLLLKIAYRLNRSIKEESFRHILHLPLYHPQRLPKGDYIYRQNEVTNSLSDLVLNTTSEIIGSVILIIGVLIVMLVINAKLTVITAIVIPFLIISVRIFGPIMAKWGQAFAILASDTASLIAESIDNTEAVQAFTLEERQVTRLKDLWAQTYIVAKNGMLWGKLFNFSSGLMVVLGTAMVIYFGGSESLKGQFNIGELLVFMTYLGYLIGPIQDITSQVTIRRQKLVNVRRVYQVLGDHEGIETLRQDRPLGAIKGKVEFQNVSLSHGDTVVLDRVNLAVSPGEKVGIIGPSGSGKSTLLRLLDLYEEPSAGRIFIDGHDIQSVSLQDLRRNIAWVSQTPQLFATTIINNMRDGDINRNISPEDLAWASAAANIGEFVGSLPNGLDTIVSESGSSLSGGQRQRISIARALLKNAPIICLDEPTSALDDKSEKLIHDSIGKLIENKTVILVTHRLGLLNLMERVYVLQNGQLRGVEDYGGLERYAHNLLIAENT